MTTVRYLPRRHVVGNCAPSGQLTLNPVHFAARSCLVSYPLTDGILTTAYDISPNHNNAVASGNTAWVRDVTNNNARGLRKGTAQENMALDRALSLGVADASSSPGNWSLNYWALKTPGGGNQNGMVCGNTADTQDYIWMSQSSTFRVASAAGQRNITTFLDFEGGWHNYHVNVRLQDDGDGYLAELFVDGKLSGTSGSSNNNTTFILSHIYDGYTSFSFDLVGSLQFFNVFNRSFTAEEVWQLHAPQTRWSLYQPAPRKFISIPAAAPAAGNTVSIITSKTRAISNRQPRWPYSIDWSSPQSRGLIRYYAAVGGVLRNLVSSSDQPVFGVSTELGASSYAGSPVDVFAGSASDNPFALATLGSGPIIATAADSTVLGWERSYTTSSAADENLYQEWNTGDSAPVFRIYIGSGENFFSQRRTDLSQNTQSFGPSSSCHDTLPHMVAVVFGGPSNPTRQYLYTDGKLSDNDQTFGTGLTIDHVLLGGGTLGNQTYHGSLWGWRVHNVSLSDAEVYEAYERPWSVLYELGRRYISLPAAAEVGTTIRTFPYVRRSIGNRAPRGNFDINPNSAQAHGLVAAFPMFGKYASMPFDLMRGQFATFSGPASETPIVREARAETQSLVQAPDDTLGNAYYLDFLGGNFLVDKDPCTLSAWIDWTDRNQAWNIPIAVGKSPAAGGSNGGNYLWHSSNSGNTDFAAGSYNGVGSTTSGTTLAHVKSVHQVGRFASATSRECFADGVSLGSETATDRERTGAFSVSINCLRTTNINWGNYSNDTPSWDLRVYDRALSDEEIWELYAPQSRWDLYRETARRYISIPVAAPEPSGLPAGSLALLGVGM